MEKARKIHLLAPSVAERIAAGEVIERPASVVKELIENSLDAGSTEVAVLLEDGGKSLIEIIDNGEGMAPPDLELCIERHATSKLSSLDDLDRIHTLGFRGEALSSIAAVSDLTLFSRTKTSTSTYELSVGELTQRILQQPQAQKVTFGNFIDSPHGTLIRARGLFSQIPARLKFLKSQGAEVSQVRDWLERLSLAYPQVGFRLMSDDRTLLNLRPQDEKSRVQTILSGGEDYPLITASNEQNGYQDLGFRVRVHWLQGLSSPNSRRLIQIVNSRAVRDRMIQQAVLAPFRQALLPGQFPAVAIFIDINPAAVDVNVHPTKTEIRFLDSSKVFRSIESLIKSMIAKNGAPAFAPTQTADSPSVTWSGFSNGFSSSPPLSSPPPVWKTAENFTQSDLIDQSHLTPQQPFTQSPLPSMPHPSSSLGPFYPARKVGVLFNTYIVYESSEELILVDQHAAHERIRYEKLRERILGPTLTSPHSSPILSAQALLIPEVTRFKAEERSLLEGRLNWILKMGFEAEIFGEDTLVFRAVPAEWGTKQLKPRLKNLVDRLMNFETTNFETPESHVILDETLFEALASEACHSAIRAGDSLEHEEVQNLAEQLFQCEHPWNCPHGRPTVVKIPQGKFEEWFQRKV